MRISGLRAGVFLVTLTAQFSMFGQGSLVYSGYVGESLRTNPDIDIDGDQTDDFDFGGYFFVQQSLPPRLNLLSNIHPLDDSAVLLQSESFDRVLPLDPGARVSENSGHWNTADSSLNPIIGDFRASQWFIPSPPDSPFHFGIKITQNDGVHYGWMQVSLITEYSTGFFGEYVSGVDVRLDGWAYHSIADTPVTAQTLPVPEPTTITLLFFGVVALGAYNSLRCRTAERNC